MMITSINLKNYKCFETQAIGTKKITLLTGLNGMGKSSVIQALLLLRQSFVDGLLAIGEIELNGPLVQLGTGQDVLYEDAQEDEIKIGITWEDDLKAEFILQYNREADVIKCDANGLNPEALKRSPFYGGFHYLKAERLGPRTSNVVSDYQVRQRHQIGSAGEFAEHFLFAYGSEVVADKKLAHPLSNSMDIKSQVQLWLQEISPGAEVHILMHPEMDIVNLRYSFLMGEQRSNRYRSTSVGFGITYVLPLLVAVLSLKPGDLILIENPEAHLHPKGQVQVGELLARAASSGAQVILETHSDHVLNGIRLAVFNNIVQPNDVAIHYFSRIEKEGRAITEIESPVIDRNGKLDHWPDGFFDEWEKSLERLILPKNGDMA